MACADEPAREARRGNAEGCPEGAGGGAGIDWAKVRQLYETSPMAVSAIRAEFGLTGRQLRVARETGEWSSRPRIARGGSAGEPRSAVSRAGASLVSALQRQVRRFETISAGRDDPAADARLLRALMEAWSIARMTEHRTTQGGERKRDINKKADDAGRDPDLAWMRAELKKRLDRLREEERLGGGG